MALPSMLFPGKLSHEGRLRNRDQVLSEYGCLQLPHDCFKGLIALCDEAVPDEVTDNSGAPGNKVFKVQGEKEDNRRYIVCEPGDLALLQQELRNVLRCEHFQAVFKADEYYVSEIWEVASRAGSPGERHIDGKYSKRGVGGTIGFHGAGHFIYTEFFKSDVDMAPRAANWPAIVFDATSQHRSPKGYGMNFERGRFFFSFVRADASDEDICEFRDALKSSYFKGFEHLRFKISVRDTLASIMPPMQVVAIENCLHSAPVGAAGAGSKSPRGSNPNSKVAAIRKGGRHRKDGGGRGRGIINRAYFTEFELNSMLIGSPHYSEPYPGLRFRGPSQVGSFFSDRLCFTKRFTDEDSCALDVLEEVCRAGFDRQKVGVPAGPVRLMSADVQRVIQREGFVLTQVWAIVGRKRKQRMVMLSLQRLMGQKDGVYIAEFQWRSSSRSDWHCVGVNCRPGGRYLFCNTLGYLPFSMGKRSESAATHDELAALYPIVSFPQCWQVTKALPWAAEHAN